MQKELEELYQSWKNSTSFGNIKGFGPPLLLNVTDEYFSAVNRILIYGQETFGWRWSPDELHRYEYPESAWEFSDQNTFADFLKADDSVGALVHGYKLFAFSQHQPTNWRSPFWTAFRQVQSVADSGVMWSNLVRADYECGSVRWAPEEQRDSFLKTQAALIQQEIRILSPAACIFFTGPACDCILETVFSDIKFHETHSEPVRRLAKLVHPVLPQKSYRTYHPGYLRRSRQWRFVEELCKQITS